MASNPKEYFEIKVAERLQEKPDAFLKINAVYQFNITGQIGGCWTVDLTKPEVRAGEDESAQCVVTAEGDDFMKVISGEVNPQVAFMSGKLRIGGDMSLAMKLGEIIV